MDDSDRIERRLAAVERALVDGDHELDDLPDAAAVAESIDRLESGLDDLERRLAGAEAEIQSVSGFVGSVEAVNEDVERRADVAVAAVDRLERRIEDLEADAGTNASAESATEGGEAANRTGGGEATNEGGEVANRTGDDETTNRAGGDEAENSTGDAPRRRLPRVDRGSGRDDGTNDRLENAGDHGAGSRGDSRGGFRNAGAGTGDRRDGGPDAREFGSVEAARARGAESGPSLAGDSNGAPETSNRAERSGVRARLRSAVSWLEARLP